MKSKFAPTNSIVLECTDTDLTRLDAKLLIGSAQPRSPEVLASRLARQFIEQNKGVLASFDIEAFQDYDGTNVSLMLRSGLKVGALPLISPTSSRPDYGLVIKPRFDWTGIGCMLSKWAGAWYPPYLSYHYFLVPSSVCLPGCSHRSSSYAFVSYSIRWTGVLSWFIIYSQLPKAPLTGLLMQLSKCQLRTSWIFPASIQTCAMIPGC